MLPALPLLADVQARLPEILPPGTPNRRNAVNETAARTIWAMLYIGAVEGRNVWLSPKHVYWMGDERFSRTDDESRRSYATDINKRSMRPDSDRWYADNSREGIRDDTLREALVPLGIVKTRPGVKTTANVGRYALAAPFAALLDPALVWEDFLHAAESWRRASLSKGALSRIAVVLRGATASRERVSVLLPNGASRLMEPGESSIITKAVVEEFAPRYLEMPAVVWISESGRKTVEADAALASRLGIDIDQATLLPDIILADVGGDELLIVFVEAVHSDGPITESRRRDLLEMATSAGHRQNRIAFVTAFMDRDQPAVRRLLPRIAIDSFLWFASEPGILVSMDSSGRRLDRRLTD